MKSRLRSIVREPLFHFVIAGTLLFILAQWLASSGETPRTIVVDRSDFERLSQQWEAQYGQAPTQEQKAALLQNHIRNEILYREALELGLDKDDVIIRRRLVQKLRFVTEGLTELAEPDETALHQFYRNHRNQYAEPAETSFQHIYFSTDERGTGAQRDARATAQTMGTKAPGIDWRRLGDPSILQREYAQRSEQELGELFGAQFVEGLRDIEPGIWSGPIPSSYGWHVVRVRERSPERIPAFPTIREAVAADWAAERRAEANEGLYQSLHEKYEVELVDIPDPEARVTDAPIAPDGTTPP